MPGDETACTDQSTQETSPTLPSAPATYHSTARGVATRRRRRALVLLSRRDGRQHAEAGPAVHGLRLSRHGLRLPARALQHGLPTAVAERPAGLHDRRPLLAPASRAVSRHPRPVRSSRLLAPRRDLLRPQHRSAPPGTAGPSHHLLAGAGGLRGARHSAHPHAARAGADTAAGDRAAVPATDQPAGSLLARPFIATTTKRSRNIAATGSCWRTSCIPRSRPDRRRCGAPPGTADPGWSAISA